ncbi:Mitochondrial 18kDa protein [Metarhizium brunneum]
MPWWGKQKEPKEPKAEPSPDANANADQQKQAFDPDKLPAREKLPRRLQNIVEKSDQDSRFFDDVIDGYAPPTTDTKLRYAAYASRFRTILLSAHRYVAYTSDIGESFRPVAHPRVVRAAYGISWLYILGDVSHEGYRAYWHNQRVLNPQLRLSPHQEKVTGLRAEDNVNLQPGVVSPLEDWRTVMVQRAIFQSIASMGLPAFTIHSVVRYSGRALKNAKNATIRTWGPIGLGLSVVPFLPRLFDEPVENAVEWVFHKGFEVVGGQKYVGSAPSTGREDMLNKPIKPKTE